MATTELSISATPGKPHSFSAKTPAVFVIPSIMLRISSVSLTPLISVSSIEFDPLILESIDLGDE